MDHAGPPFCALDQQESEEIEAHRGPDIALASGYFEALVRPNPNAA